MSSHETTVWTEASPIVITDIWGKTVEGFWLLISFCGKFGLCCFHAWLNLLQYTTEGGSIHNATEFEKNTKVCDVWFYNGALQAPREISFSWEEFGVLKPWKGYFSLCGLHCGGGLLSRDLIISYALFKSMKTIWRSLQASIFFY